MPRLLNRTGDSRALPSASRTSSTTGACPPERLRRRAAVASTRAPRQDTTWRGSGLLGVTDYGTLRLDVHPLHNVYRVGAATARDEKRLAALLMRAELRDQKAAYAKINRVRAKLGYPRVGREGSKVGT